MDQLSERIICAHLLKHPKGCAALRILKKLDFLDPNTKMLFQLLHKWKDSPPRDIAEIYDRSRKEDGVDISAGFLAELIETGQSFPYDEEHIVEAAKRIRSRSRVHYAKMVGEKLSSLCVEHPASEQTMENLGGKLNKIIKFATTNENEGVIDNDFFSADDFVHTGFWQIDKFCPMSIGDYVVIAALPSKGKTALACNLALNFATLGRKVCFISTEMSQRQLGQRLMAIFGRVPLMKFRRQTFDHAEKMRVATESQNLTDMPIRVYTTSYMTKLEELIATTKPDVVIVDYLQRIVVDSESRFDRVTAVTERLADLALSEGFLCIALSQLNRNVISEKREDSPKLADLRQSGQIEQDADVVMFIVQEPGAASNYEVTLLVEKQRNGPTGKIHMKFFPEFGIFA